MELFYDGNLENCGGFGVGDVPEELPVRRGGRVGPAPVDHAGRARRQRRQPRQEHHRVVDVVRLRDRRQEPRLRHLREVGLHLQATTSL